MQSICAFVQFEHGCRLSHFTLRFLFLVSDDPYYQRIGLNRVTDRQVTQDRGFNELPAG